MSKISYQLARIMEDLNETEKKEKSRFTTIYKIFKYFILDLWYDYPYVLFCKIKAIYRNFRFFLPHIIDMRNWDSSYQIKLFADSLDYLADGLKTGNHVNADKVYRRCKTAAAKLRKAYYDNVCYDKSYRRLTKNNPIKFIKLPCGMSQMTHDYAKGEEYYNKMSKIIHTRTEKVIKENKKEAWDYIHKYIEYFWD